MPDNALKYLSICSGIEAATVAWHALGWKPAGFSEIDPFARAVLTEHYPDVPLHGDFTAIDQSPHDAIDLLVGGTPCQSFSIAGLRKGLADDRGNLALEFIRLAKRTRPRWLVWENVPGVLSIDGGRAFGSFLGGLAECGYGFAYRILDAQYFGVPQRRRRVFVVGYLGDWRPAAAVLFELESLQRDITPGGKARERIADSLTVGANQCSGRPGDFVEHDVAHTLEASDGGVSGKEGRGLITHTLRGDGFDASEDGTGRGTPLVAGTVSSKWSKGTGGPSGDECQNLVAANCIAFSGKDYGADAADSAPTLRAMGHDKSHANAGGQIAVAIPLQEIGKRTGTSTDDASIGVGIGHDGDAMFTLQAAAQHGIAFAQNSRDEVRMLNGDGDLAGALSAQPGMKQQTFVAFEPGSIARNAGPTGLSETCSTLRAEMGDNQPAVLHPLDLRNAMRDPDKRDAVNRQGCGIGGDGDPAPTVSTTHMPGIISPMVVRRLTPRECERLQGFPDDYTQVPFRGKPSADGPRYKALGNSMAVPVMRWLGGRIQKVDSLIKLQEG